MYPYIKIFDREITAYAIFAIVGVLVSGFVACKLTKKKHCDDNDMIILLLISAIGVFLGGHILYSFTKFNVLIKIFNNLNLIDSFTKFINAFIYIFGGSVFYGGLIGGLIFGYAYIKKKNLNKEIFMDIGAVIIPLFHMFGRIGCFFTGCCYGIESKFGFVFTNSIVESANYVNRFPIQLIEAFYNFIIFLFLFYLNKNNKFKGELLNLYLVLYPIGRFIFEFFRADSYRGFIFGISISQFISIILLILSLLHLLIKNKKLNINKWELK